MLFCRELYAVDITTPDAQWKLSLTFSRFISLHDWNADRAVEAKSSLLINDIKFVLMLLMFCDLLGQVHVVANLLQSASFVDEFDARRQNRRL